VWRGIAQNTLSNNGKKNQKNVEKVFYGMAKPVKTPLIGPPRQP
jgi:hypothetical protein